MTSIAVLPAHSSVDSSVIEVDSSVDSSVDKCALLAEKLKKLQQLGTIFLQMNKTGTSGKRKFSEDFSDEETSEDSEYEENTTSEDEEDTSDEEEDSDEEDSDEDKEEEECSEKTKRDLKELNSVPFLSDTTKKLIKKGILKGNRENGEKERKIEKETEAGKTTKTTATGEVEKAESGSLGDSKVPPKKVPKGDWGQRLEDIWKSEKRRYKTVESKETIDKLTSTVEKMSLELEKKAPSLRSIIESDVDEKTKQELISLYILHDGTGISSEKLTLKEKLIEKLNAKKLSPERLELKNRLYKSNECGDSLRGSDLRARTSRRTDSCDSPKISELCQHVGR